MMVAYPGMSMPAMSFRVEQHETQGHGQQHIAAAQDGRQFLKRRDPFFSQK